MFVPNVFGLELFFTQILFLHERLRVDSNMGYNLELSLIRRYKNLSLIPNGKSQIRGVLFLNGSKTGTCVSTVEVLYVQDQLLYELIIFTMLTHYFMLQTCFTSIAWEETLSNYTCNISILHFLQLFHTFWHVL